jgi:2-phospho-L-lactate guanylyltransferase
MSTEPADWFVVVPVKGGAEAKSRLGVPARAVRTALAAALAHDTVAAAVAAMPPGRVLVVTGDPVTAGWARAAGAEVVADPGEGLDAAALTGGAAVRSRGGADVAVLLGDHPALRPAELRAALAAAAAYQRTVVPDADGTGTALLTARGADLAPRFGAGSAARHVEAAATLLPLDLPGLRQDVDDLASLRAVLALGVGPFTRDAATGSLRSVQASIHTYDDTSGGIALLDDGRTIEFGPDALADSGLRFLRPGQRVSVEVDVEARRATRVWIVGIGDSEVIR